METILPADVTDLAAPTASTPKLSGSVANRAIEQYIVDSGRFLEETRVSEDICEVLNRYGFDDEELSIGMALQAAAMKTCGANHAGNARDRGAVELQPKVAAARDDFDGFRLVARAVFPALNDRANLRVMGDVPDDLQRFVNVAHTAYTTAAQEPYAAKLAKRGYGPERLKSLQEFLDALAWLDAAHEAAAEGTAADTTSDRAERDAAYHELRVFMKEIKGVARAAFRKDPETLAKLGLAK